MKHRKWGRQEMKQKWKCPIAAALILCLIVGILWPAMVVKADSYDFAADLKVGYNNKAEIGRYAPFMVTVENKGSDFSGRLQVIVGNKVSYNIMYETDFSLARGETKTVNFACKVADNLGKANIRLVNKKEKVLWSEEKRFSVDKTALQNIDIGILSDDFAALGYMDNLQFFDRETFKTNLMELTSDTFPEDVNALDMLEMIVISNFSTDILTDEQIEALSLWVSRGGFLIIGTGSNSSKTLSKLNNRIVEVKSDKMSRYQTSFGLNLYGEKIANYNYTTEEGNPDNDEEFLESFDEIWYNYREDVDKECLEDYMANNYLTEDDLDSDGKLPYYFEDDYYNYCKDYYYYTYWYTQSAPVVSNYAYNSELADVLEFEEGKGYETIFGDSTAGDYELGRVYRSADGYIALYGIDFTMNPLPKYQDAGDILKYIIQRYVLKGVIERYDSSSGGYNYNYNFGSQIGSNSYQTRQFLEKLSSAPLPPLIFYVIPIVAYLVAILVMYLSFKRKKKTFRLWYWYPILAVGVAVITFSIGFSTRIIKPRIYAATVIDLNRPSTVEKNYVSVITPSNKVSEVGFSNDYDIQLIREQNSYYDNSDKVNLDTYRVAFRREIDQTYVRFKGNVALSSDQFNLESIYPDTRTFEAQYVTNNPKGSTSSLAEEVIITNNTGLDLENAVVYAVTKSAAGSSYVHGSYYRIGDFKSGSTVDMTAKSFTGSQSYSSSPEVAFTDEDKHMVSGFFLGSLSEGFKQYHNRSNLLDFIGNDIDEKLGNQSDIDPREVIYVIGFPKDSSAKSIQANDKYRVERTELVIQKILLSDMPQVVKK